MTKWIVDWEVWEVWEVWEIRICGNRRNNHGKLRIVWWPYYKSDDIMNQFKKEKFSNK
jgi:hypothetical protein